MKLLWRMGWRNVWRNPRRSIITVGALAFSVALLVFFIGMMESYVSQMEENIIGLNLGHIQVHHPQYLSDQSLYQVVEGSAELVDKLQAQGMAASARLYGYGLLASDDTGSSAGVRLKGIEIDDEATVTSLNEPGTISAGRYLSEQLRSMVPADPDADPGDDGAGASDEPYDPLADVLEVDSGPETLEIGEMVLGRKLAKTLGVSPGDTVNVVTMAADGTIGNELFDVVGVLKNYSDIDDRSLALITSRDFRRLFKQPEDQAHEIAVRLPAHTDLAAGKAAVAAVVGDAGKVETWREIEPAMSQMLDYMRSATLIFSMTLYVGAAMLIMNSMLMMVFERIRELGVMKAIGLKAWQLLVLVYCETVGICIVAAVIGVVVGVPLTLWVGHVGLDLSVLAPDGFSMSGTVLDPVMRTELTSNTLVIPVVSLFVISFFSVLYPAIKAAVIEPVKAISHV